MKDTEHTAKTPSPRTGFFATLRALLHVNGTSAPSPRPTTAATGTPSHSSSTSPLTPNPFAVDGGIPELTGTYTTRSAPSGARTQALRIAALMTIRLTPVRAWISRRSAPLPDGTGYTQAALFGGPRTPHRAAPLRARLWRGRKRGAVVCVAVAMGLLPSTAQAHFTRPFLRQITQTSPGHPLGLPDPQNGSAAGAPAALALDSADRLWLGDGLALDRFAPAYAPGESAFQEAFPTAIAPEGLAIEPPPPTGTGDLYLLNQRSTGPVEVYSPTGAHLAAFGSFDEAQIAVDDSTEPSDPSACGVAPLAPSECTLYVSHAQSLKEQGAAKLDSKGEPEPFSFAKACEEQSGCNYVRGNQILGVPKSAGGARAGTEYFEHAEPERIAVDPQGDIYLGADRAVYEYNPSGEYKQQFNLESDVKSGEIPPLEQGVGFGGISALGFDPQSGHLLIGTYWPRGSKYLAAVYEFDPKTTKYITRFTEAEEGSPLDHPAALATDSHGDLYLADNAAAPSGAVDVYGPGHFLPGLQLGLAAKRAAHSALLQASVDPEGFQLTSCAFQYVTEAAFQANVKAHGGHQSEGFADLSSGGEAPCESPNATEVGSGDAPVAVHATLSAHIEPGSTYRYRVSATSEGELGGTAQSPTRAFTAPAPPAISATSADGVSSAFATLHATIDPLGAATSYYFQYLTQAQYEQNGDSFAGPNLPAATPAATIGSGGPTGSSPEAVLQHVGSLVPGTEYRFRAIAENECEEASRCQSEGPAQTFTTLPPAQAELPDHRAYELVTPAAKTGGSDMFSVAEVDGEFEDEHNHINPAQSGEALIFETRSTFGAFPFAGPTQADLIRREAQSGVWSATSLAAPALGVQSYVEGSALASPDLSRLAFNETRGSLAQRPTSLLGSPGAPYLALHEDLTGVEKPGSDSPDTRVLGASRDLSHLILASAPPLPGEAELCPGAHAVSHGDVLCQFSGGFEEPTPGESVPALSMVDVSNEEGKPVSKCGAALGAGFDGDGHGTAYRAVSADGSRVLFTAPDPVATLSFEHDPGIEGKEGCWNGGEESHGAPPRNAPQLYQRVNGERTLQLSAPEAGVKEEGHAPLAYPAYYSGASEDGSRVFFVTKTELTAEAAADHLHDWELYEWRSEGAAGPAGPCAEGAPGFLAESEGCLTRVSAGEAGTPGNTTGAHILHVPATAAGGEAVYFIALSRLTADAPAAGGVYRYDTASGATAYVAPGGAWRPGSAEAQLACPENSLETTTEETFSAGFYCSNSEWNTTRDGRYLLFAGAGGLQRYDALAAAEGKPSLTCVSCVPGGEGSHGRSKFNRSASQSLPSAAPVRALSEDGSYVFFDSPEKLVPQAANQTGPHPPLDVYEWEADGAGSCQKQAGCISLIGSGSSPASTYFLGQSPYEYTNSKGETKLVEAGNVYIGTHAQLVPQDTDALGDIYDARVCEPESPCIEPPPQREGLCEGDACAPAVPAPHEETPGSLTFHGAGNVHEEPTKKTCPKGKVLKPASVSPNTTRTPKNTRQSPSEPPVTTAEVTSDRPQVTPTYRFHRDQGDRKREPRLCNAN